MNRFNAELLGIGIRRHIWLCLAFLANIIADRLTEEKDPLTITQPRLIGPPPANGN